MMVIISRCCCVCGSRCSCCSEC